MTIDRTMAARLALRAALADIVARHPEMTTGKEPNMPVSDPNDPNVQLALRLPKSLIESVDAFALATEAATPGMVCTRTDATRMLLMRGLDSLGRCAAVKGEHVCTLHSAHAGTHFDSHKDKSWR